MTLLVVNITDEKGYSGVLSGLITEQDSKTLLVFQDINDAKAAIIFYKQFEYKNSAEWEFEIVDIDEDYIKQYKDKNKTQVAIKPPGWRFPEKVVFGWRCNKCKKQGELKVNILPKFDKAADRVWASAKCRCGNTDNIAIKINRVED